MVLLAGGIPLFADIRRESCAIDAAQVESLIDARTGAVLITHLHGETAGAHEFRDICNRRCVPLIEDAAQAFGAVERNRRLGTIGDLGIYSFGFYKNVNAWRGGMLVSSDRALIARIRRRIAGLPAFSRLRLLALSARGLMTEVATYPPIFSAVTNRAFRLGFLHKVEAIKHLLDPEYGATRISQVPADYLIPMAPSQMELAYRQLDQVDADSYSRIAHAALYHEGLSDVESLITPRRHNELSHIYTCFPVQCCDRDSLLRYAINRKRDFAAQHLRNCADLPEFKEFHRNCPNARAAAKELILLPTYPRYPTFEVRRNIEVIHDFLEANPWAF
jgi:dTDP-4-amino-4,6-dideoxygalactose transaminase